VSARILIVDDHEIVRSGLRRLVERQSGWEVCGEAVNGKEAIEKALALNPDLVLMDISMPVMSGIEATRQIRELSPVTKIVIVSLHDDESIAAEAKNAGADAYVVKACPSEILLKTIETVLQEGRRPACGPRLTHPATGNPLN
jgi:two-component system, NarL family, nitrate/nitrite response regulator NarL